jgi:signal transduction histidine kinase/DNA-binding response OmpR family regulator
MNNQETIVSESAAAHILLVEDEPAHAAAIQRALQITHRSLTVLVAGTLGEYRRLVSQGPPQLAIVDLNLPDGRALEILTAPPEAGPFPILIMTSYGSEQMAVEAMKSGALDYVVKSPETFAEMSHIVDRALRQWRVLQERQLARTHIGHLNSVLRAIRDVNQLISRETSAARLIQRACDLMVSHRSYGSALIALIGPDGRPAGYAQAGPADPFRALAAELENGQLPGCCRRAVESRGAPAVAELDRDCAARPGTDARGCLDTLCIALSHQSTTHGCLAVAVERPVAVDPEERTLFAEMAGDLGYALHNLAARDAIRVADAARAKLEAQLIQAQKMESVGRLAGGVAHDFNNMLSLIIGYAELAMDAVGPADKLREDLKEILQAARRATEITRQLLAFARQQPIAPKVLDLNEAVHSMLKMLRRLIGEEIDLAWRPQTGLWPVKMDPTQIDQLLANLCVNARDAIAGVGKITIETGRASFDEAYCAVHAGFVPGDFVLLAVSDDGCGMDKETLGKIFEPFFTTKGVGQGTGLGLATVYGIVKQNNGFINVYSEPGKGTTIRIYLQLHSGQVQKIEARGAVGLPPGRGETVMIVEDEPAIMKMGVKMLEKLGYRLLASGSPGEALRLAGQHAGTIDLLLTDVVMPEMNGRELSSRMQALFPQIKTLFMSGYTASVIAHRGVLDEGVNFIQKPLSKPELASKVRAVLDDQAKR